MDGFFGVLKFMAAVYLGCHALLWTCGIVFGPIAAGWLLFFLIPIFICNALVGLACAKGTNETLARQRKRRAWRGY